MPTRLVRHTALALCVAVCGGLAPAVAAPPSLPAGVDAALDAAQVPRDAMVAFVQEVGGRTRPLLAWRPDEPVNPASLMKLVTTSAALDLLGPAWTWRTPVWLHGQVADGVLDGDLVIQGSGDPRLGLERVWLLLRRVRALGVQEIRGDIVLDRSAFAAPEQNPGDFDGEPRRPYNVQPDALLLNQKSFMFSFTPDPARGLAQVVAEPPLAEAQVDAGVALADGPCEDWRAALRPDLSDPQHTRFGGSFALACGERLLTLADSDPVSYNARLLAHLWRELGGTLGGSVHDGMAPATAPSFEVVSPPLAEVVRDINKFSNNVMAQQLFLTLGLSCRSEAPVQLGSIGNSKSGLLCTTPQVLRSGLSCRSEAPVQLGSIGNSKSGLLCTTPQVLRSGLSCRSEAPVQLGSIGNSKSGLLCTTPQVLRSGLTQRSSGSPPAARALLRQWLAGRIGRSADTARIDNGSGLSRDTRLSARLLARLLHTAWASPWMPELMASLPVAGLDGTLRRSQAAVGRAHLKTGSLRDVLGIAGYVLAASGRRYVVVGIVNHANSGQARPALEALVDWAAADAPGH
jgi:PBP4 family serine-type D-alanyl-D-alanine carboxypeptidase